MVALLLLSTSMQAQKAYAVLSSDGKTVTFYYDTQKESRGGIDINNTNSFSPYGSATTAVIDDSFANYRPTSTAYWFYNCQALSSITGMENLKTGNVADMSWMFFSSGLRDLNLSSFNTGNVKNMSYMFDGCYRLTSLDVSSFNTSKVTDMRSMFSSCSGLTSLDVSNFNTSNVTYMSSMFSGCSILKNLDVSGFNTGNVTDMGKMFSNCSYLTSLNVSGFKVDNVTTMENMFYGCRSITALDVSNFKTGNVTNMKNMFCGCLNLINLDVSNFNTSNVTDMSSMFYNCRGLKTIYASDGWSTEKVSSESSRNMFYGCSNLIGGHGTVYNREHIDYTYARIDGGAQAPGYFTYKEHSGIKGVSTNAGVQDLPVYNISGQRLSAPRKGINIVGDRKVVK